MKIGRAAFGHYLRIEVKATGVEGSKGGGDLTTP
jgi:hypothetical protein